jgi:hypothetical protein
MSSTATALFDAASPSPGPYIPPHLGAEFTKTWGMQFIGFALDLVLYGAAMICVIQYFRTQSKRDTRFINGVIAILGIVATVQALFLTIQNYKDYVSFFGDLDKQDKILVEANVMLLATYIVAFVSQIFYLSRIWILTGGNYYYSVPVGVLALVQICAGVAQTVFVAKVHTYRNLPSTEPVTSAQSGAAAACDVLITVILCYILHDSRSSIRRTNSVVDKLILYAINRGMATSTAALLNLAFFVGLNGTQIFTIPLLPSCQLYVISVCSMLMSRESLRADLHGDPRHDSVPLGSLSSGNHEGNFVTVPNTNVLVSTSVVKWTDDHRSSRKSERAPGSFVDVV